MSNYTNSSLNARKHGCCAVDTALLPNESAADLKTLETLWLTAYSPANETERHLVQEFIHADFLLQRTPRTLLDIESRLYAETPNPLDWTDHQQRALGRFLRYRTAHTNTVAKCRKAIEDYRKARLAEKITDQKLQTAGKKNHPVPDWIQHLENMRQQAISLGFTPPHPDSL